MTPIRAQGHYDPIAQTEEEEEENRRRSILILIILMIKFTLSKKEEDSMSTFNLMYLWRDKAETSDSAQVLIQINYKINVKDVILDLTGFIASKA